MESIDSIKHQKNEMKYCGIDWIGLIPASWEIGKLYQYSRLTNGSTPSKNKEEYWSNGTIPWMTSGEINKKIVKDINLKISKKGFQESSLEILPIGTVMLGLNGQGKTKGTVGILEVETTCNQSLCGIIPNNKIFSKYLYYFLESQYKHLRGLVGEGKREGISVSFLSRYPVLIPSLKTQILISKFLDQRIFQIDCLIEKIREKIELIKEYKNVLINQYVTKGLNPNNQMKYSEIDWIGEIPEDWEIGKFKYLIDVLTDYTSNGSFQSLAENVKYLDKGYSRLIRLTDLRKNFKNKGIFISEESHNFLKKSELFGNEILVASVGSVGVVVKMPINKGKCSLAPNMYLVRNNIINSDTDYVLFLLNSNFVQNQLKLLITSTAQPKINKDNLKSLRVLIPPLEEQKKIAEYLTVKNEQIDLIIHKEEKRISLLQEYRKSLISSVVTGKIQITEDIL